MSVFPAERKCAICKKKFIGFDQWVFKRRDSWYCSWSCLREHERQSKARIYGQRLSRDDKAEVRKMLEAGIKPQRIADKMGVTLNAVLYYQSQINKAGA